MDNRYNRGIANVTLGNDVTNNISYKVFACGYGAAFINICITFPINKIMFRQMAYGLKTNHAFNQIKMEGFLYLYRGILPPLMQKTLSVSLMFGTFHHYHQILSHTLSLPSSLNTTLSALLAGCTESILTPFERVQMLLQDRKYHERFFNTFHAFRELKKYGIREYYRGLTPILLRNGPSNVMFFSLRTKANDWLKPSDEWLPKLVIDFISGAAIGAATSTIFYPLNVIRTKMQTHGVGCDFLSIHQAAKMVYYERDKSLSKIYYGVHINYTRALISWGIINASYELLLKIF